MSFGGFEIFRPTVRGVDAGAFVEPVDAPSLSKHPNGRHGGRHGNGKGSERFKRHGPSGKKGVDCLPPEKREERHRENRKKKQERA